MRWIAILCLALGLVSQAMAKTATKGPQRLLTYDELMRLNPEKRKGYIRDLSHLLVLLERQQIKYQIADNSYSKKDVAALLKALELMPSAEAQSSDGISLTFKNGKGQCSGYVAPPFRVDWDPKAGVCALQQNNQFDFSRLANGSNICPANSHPYRHRGQLGCIPNSVFEQMSSSRQTDIDSGVELPANAFSSNDAKNRETAMGAASDNSPTPAPAASAPSQPATSAPATSVDICAAPKAQSCPTGAPSADVIAKFQKSAGKGECLRGGFFSNYKNGVYTANGCEVGKNPVGSSCPANTEVCNPAVFCFGFIYDKKLEKNVGEDIPADRRAFVGGTICAKPDAHFTENCEASLKEKVGKPIGLNLTSLINRAKGTKDPATAQKYMESFYPKYKDQPGRQCDPADVPYISGKYRDLINSTQASYKRLCGDDSFKAMFCDECNVIAAHLAHMNCTATGKASLGDADVVAPKGSATDSSTSN
jgi:hypothetical protein